MNKTIVFSSDAPAPIGPYSQAVAAGGMLFVSGQIAADAVAAGLPIAEETRRIMHQLGHILAAAGLDYGHIVKATIFLKNMDDFTAVNEAYGSFFSEHFPARETVQVARLPKDVNIEISVVAVMP